ncbi:hypothetical protein COLO4_29744 [Corchorus olitorius]|uniref:Uncharacterized protein n=1 Tax=Corchorus olitorius TaxID=93759 RepID=A0A1R3HDA9_9ROSI|nr:hypothetical protein COLO4_29744 [Corchorus olitorius]
MVCVSYHFKVNPSTSRVWPQPATELLHMSRVGPSPWCVLESGRSPPRRHRARAPIKLRIQRSMKGPSELRHDGGEVVTNRILGLAAVA